MPPKIRYANTVYATITGNTTTIMYKVLQEEPLAPSKLNVGLPGAFDEVMRKAIAKSPADRYQTAAEFAAAIQSAVTAPSVNRAEATVINQNVAPPPLPASAEASALRSRTSPSFPGAPAAPAPAAPVPPPPAAAPVSKSNKALVGIVAGTVLLAAAGGFGYWYQNQQHQAAPAVASPSTSPTTPAATAPAPAPVPAAQPVAAREPASEPGYVTISALGFVDPKDPKFNGDAAAAQAEARADAKRQLLEKALAMFVDNGSLKKNYALLEQRLFKEPGNYIKTVLQEAPPTTGKDGLVEAETRAVVKSRDLQKSLNQLSKEERVEFIRNNGDPKVAIQMNVANAETAQALPSARSQLAENVVKERIKSFGFRVWNEGDTATGPNARGADFVILGEAKVKPLSMRLAASGVTVTKTALTSWTVKAIDKATGEEIYLNTITPQGKSWNTEDQALAEIGKLVGEEFSKNFFLQYFNVGVRQTSLGVTGLPDAEAGKALLRELRGVRQVLDVQMTGSGQYRLVVAENAPADLVQTAILKPLNTKMGRSCFELQSSGAAESTVAFSAACAEAAVRAKLDTVPPAGLLDAPPSRGQPLLKGRISA